LEWYRAAKEVIGSFASESPVASTDHGRRLRRSPPDLTNRLENLPRVLQERGIRLAYLFGSLVETPREARPEDVDLALLTDGEPAERLRPHLAEALGTERIDIVDLATAPPVLRFEIVRSGHPVHVRDDETLNRFELDPLHLYRDTAPMRPRQTESLRERMKRWS